MIAPPVAARFLSELGHRKIAMLINERYHLRLMRPVEGETLELN
jgi:hypothetical protein